MIRRTALPGAGDRVHGGVGYILATGCSLQRNRNCGIDQQACCLHWCSVFPILRHSMFGCHSGRDHLLLDSKHCPQRGHRSIQTREHIAFDSNHRRPCAETDHSAASFRHFRGFRVLPCGLLVRTASGISGPATRAAECTRGAWSLYAPCARSSMCVLCGAVLAKCMGSSPAKLSTADSCAPDLGTCCSSIIHGDPCRNVCVRMCGRGCSHLPYSQSAGTGSSSYLPRSGHFSHPDHSAVCQQRPLTAACLLPANHHQSTTSVACQSLTSSCAPLTDRAAPCERTAQLPGS